MDESKPYFSIVIATYNRANLIGKTLDTVWQQTDPDFEVIVVNDGSRDHTEEVLAAIQDPRLIWFTIPNSERSVARNRGIARARGEYVTFLDSDDWLLPHYLEEARTLIRQKKRPEFFSILASMVLSSCAA